GWSGRSAADDEGPGAGGKPVAGIGKVYPASPPANAGAIRFAPAPDLIIAASARPGRWDHPALRAPVHWIALAIAADAGDRGPALSIRPEAAVPPATAVAAAAILRAPGIGDLGAGGRGAARGTQAAKRQSRKDVSHRLSLLER